MSIKVLVIDDDHDFGKVIEAILTREGYQVYFAHSGVEGLKQVYEVHPDLILLDVMMAGMDGFTLCLRLREMVDTPILMCTALTGEKEILHGFSVGVDDFLRKPFSNDELKVRIQALLRRSRHLGHNETNRSMVAYADSVLEVDFSSRMVKLLGKRVELSPKEYDLLAFLVREQGRVVSHHEMALAVWGNAYGDVKAIVSLYIYYLRKKLQDGRHGHRYFCTHWGRGYWFAPRYDTKAGLEQENQITEP
jgi:DNA-binding response OmpR family regulator